MPTTVPKPRQAFPVEHDDEADAEFHDGLFGFLFDAAHGVAGDAYAADDTNVQFASSGWADEGHGGQHGGFPLRSVIGDTPQFKLRERTQGRRICCSLPRGTPAMPRTWFSLSLPGHAPHFQPTHYRLRHGKSSKFYAMRSWNLLGSRDGERWCLLQAHHNETLLQAPFAVATFRLWSENVDIKNKTVRCCLPHCTKVVAPLEEPGVSGTGGSGAAGHRASA